MCIKALLALLLLSVLEGVSGASLFAVLEGQWSACRAINATDACYRTREVVCVRTSDNRTAPWYYCVDGDRQRPPSVEICDEGSCVQDCVVTEWSAWSDCNCENGFYTTRSRRVVVPLRNGGESCPSLQERETCSICINNALFDSLPRKYTWKTGDWEPCSTLDTTKQCGSGIQNRLLECVGLDGNKAPLSNCLRELAYSNVLPPPTSRLCSVPCNCTAGEWAPWSACLSVCNVPHPHTAQTRTLQQPTENRADCPPLTETRECPDLPPTDCPSYSWNTSEWTSCQHQTDASCGAGHMTRYLYCLKELNGTVESVDLDLCDLLSGSPRPDILMSCHTVCPQACVLGAWSPWSECVPSCEITYSNRTRDILVTPEGEEGCSHTLEVRVCPVLPCVHWSPGEFSECYVPDQGCGRGTQSRDIQCTDVLGNTIEYHRCLQQLIGLPQPAPSQDCYVPCPHDCVVSEWTPWTPCTHICGADHGTQTRTRMLVAVGNNCTYSEEDFHENRTCSSPNACDPPSYHILVGDWSECRDAPISSGDLPYLFDESELRSCITGIQNRTSYCMFNGSVIEPEDCPIQFFPTEKQSCVLSCEEECIFSPWSQYSQCSASCGTGTRTRSRWLIQFPDSPQSECSVNEEGLQVETIPCDLPDCSTSVYEWVGGTWRDCVPFSSLPSSSSDILSTTCGHGFQTTPLTCVDVSTREIVTDDMCIQATPPPTTRPCVIPCPDRCILTQWTDFTACENGQRNRTRQIIPFTSSSDWIDSCPQLASVSLVEMVECSPVNLNKYDYSVLSTYSSTILDSPTAVCGNGYEYRSVACIDMLTIKLYDDEFCDHRSPPESVRLSSIKCETDCVQSEWSPWSSCSVSCGYGHRTRTRSVVKEPLEEEGGRPCGPHVEVDVCFTQPCLYVEYQPGPYSICNVTNTSSVCGPGVRTREALCVVNGVLQESTYECESQGASVTFQRSEACEMPCPGACVYSEWGEWSSCNCIQGTGTCQRDRERTVLRERTQSGQCTDTQEIDNSCQPESSPYSWLDGVWGNCTLESANPDINPGAYCGSGVQRRSVKCVRSLTGETKHDSLCGVDKPRDIQNCTVPCPVDCVLSAFSTWSPCPQRCEQHLEQIRTRSRLIAPKYGGRTCPDEKLVQKRSCPPVDCTVFEVQSHESDCEPDLTPASQCGSAQLSNPLNCRRNTQYTDLSVCLEAIDQGRTVLGSEGVSSSTSCSLQCPAEPTCSYTEWSSWSECTSLCVDSNALFRFRTQALVSHHIGEDQLCENMQHEVQECGMLELDLANSTNLIPFNSSRCIGFQWKTSDFDVDGTRSVLCMTDTGLQVNNGCPYETKPAPTRQSCDPNDCPAHSSCSNNKCVCSPEFELVTDVCLPVSGCSEDSHCLYAHTVCSGGECVCKHNFRSMDGRCVYIGPPTTPPPVTTIPDDITDTSTVAMTTIVITDTDETTSQPTAVTVPNSTSTEEDTPPATLEIPYIAVIATVPLVIIIIIVAILIFVMYRCRKSLEKEHQMDSLKRRANISISAPSPVHSIDRYGHRGADSASSGFVDDLEHDQYKYGMAGKTFLGSQRMGPSSREDIDEAAFAAEFPAQAPPTPSVHPIPVPVPTLPGYQLEHMSFDYRAREVPTDVPEGDFTTDITLTTDDGSVVTTSLPPSSNGSPNVSRKRPHPQVFDEIPSQNTYVSMHPIYSQVTPRSQRSHGESHDRDNRSHDHRERLQSTESHDYRDRVHSSGSRDYRSRAHSSGSRNYRDNSYDYTDYRDDYRGRPHDHRQRSRSAPGRDNYRVYEHHREQYYSRRDQRSPSPNEPASPQSRRSRDRGIATGLDNSLVQAISQMGPRAGTPEHSIRSSGSRGSQRRRSGRRRRYHGQPHHMTYHHSNRYRYNSDGPSDHELTSASEAEQSYYHRRMPSRSLPVSPPHLTDPDEPDYDTLPPPHVRVHPATPPRWERRVYSPEHAPFSRVNQLKADKNQEGHYDYPRRLYNSTQEGAQSPPTHVTQPPPSQLSSTQSPPSHVTQAQSPLSQVAQSPPLSPSSQLSFPQSPSSQEAQSPPSQPSPPPLQVTSTLSPPVQTGPPPLQLTSTLYISPPAQAGPKYTHVTPLKLAPADSSPLLSRRQHPPSPLAIHSRSGSNGGLVTNGEVTTFGHPIQDASSNQYGQ